MTMGIGYVTKNISVAETFQKNTHMFNSDSLVNLSYAQKSVFSLERVLA
jgi:hypothetical protein